MEKVKKVLAATKIFRGARTGCFIMNSEVALMGTSEGGPETVQVGIWTNGEIQPLNISQIPPFWPKLIRLAPDCHVENIRLSRVNRDAVALHAVKDIAQGGELLLWFDEDVLVDDMGIPPYLSPSNIRGGNSYICTSCQASFETPNPLKVHIALKCDTLPKSVLWGRLISSNKGSPVSIEALPSSRQIWSPIGIPSSSSSNTPTPPIIPLPLMITTTHHMKKFGGEIHHYQPQQSQPPPFPVPLPLGGLGPLTLPIVNSSSIIPNGNGNNNSPHIPPSTRPSENHQTIPRNPSSNKPRISSSPQGSNNAPPHPPRRCRNPQLEKAITVTVSDPEAQLESIVSNMGKGRNGHVCLYCGKLYSRKYGLKIHIRTHTGYKPLRCKICHRPFGDPSNLNKHIRLHSDGNTPYRCDICNKVLVRKRDLDRHIRSRHTPLNVNLNLTDALSSSSQSPLIPTSVQVQLDAGIALDYRRRRSSPGLHQIVQGEEMMMTHSSRCISRSSRNGNNNGGIQHNSSSSVVDIDVETP